MESVEIAENKELLKNRFKVVWETLAFLSDPTRIKEYPEAINRTLPELDQLAKLEEGLLVAGASKEEIKKYSIMQDEIYKKYVSLYNEKIDLEKKLGEDERDQALVEAIQEIRSRKEAQN